ncbi:MAG: prepilin-type N-terminal cleavage/methylation domain-containing protein [Vampirovibrionales bacterium]|nr:prepilin-type N-terminal cleavage/methylation domain-containing protein [Vampirovibrionales bacterium]
MIKTPAFTLAELLIALLILGVIATFTIPKVLTSQTNARAKAIAKEVAGTISESLLLYKHNSQLAASTHAEDLTPYMNYLSVLTSGSVDDIPTYYSYDCSDAGLVCLKLHNGGVMVMQNIAFGGTSGTNAVIYSIDPDGSYSGLDTGPGKAVEFWLYANGKVRTKGTIDPGTTTSWGADNPNPAQDPIWFSWN